ncbi:hypothetical protein ACIRRH_32880 [Kitasatospora sp. NPDC101235]|uniref:hypothetical protein n=1 Tax=Kitasatospora sp. NPDC101235 TaxID=3364101 RepID=UPI00382E7D21
MTVSTLRSPNTVLAKAVEDAVDVLRPRIVDSDIESIGFSVGTQINGHPHLGTHLVQSLAFLLAERARDEFGLDTGVDFCALDNSPAETIRADGRRYQRAYVHALSADEISSLVARHYLPLFDACRARTNVPYMVSTYTHQQDTPAFRAEFLRTLELLDAIGTWLSPNSGSAHIRLPCPACGWAEKYADRTRLLELDEAGGLFEAHCFEHGRYEADITPLGGGYLDLATLYRNVVKERSYRPDDRTLHVMVKGGDWAFGCQLVDGAHAALGLPVGPPASPDLHPPDPRQRRRQALEEPTARSRRRRARPGRHHPRVAARPLGLARHPGGLRRSAAVATAVREQHTSSQQMSA